MELEPNYKTFIAEKVIQMLALTRRPKFIGHNLSLVSDPLNAFPHEH